MRENTMHAGTPALLREMRATLLERAAALGIEGDREEDIIDALLEREVRVEPPSEADCHGYFVAREQTFRSGSVVEADHIFFAPKEDAQRPVLRAFAQQQLDLLRGDENGFAAAARRWSNCPSANLGGNLGQLTRNDVVPEFWQAVANAGRPGLLPELVESRYGIHIVRINRFEPGRPLTFEAVRRQIEERLAQERREPIS
jgi:peptidyl-prolyl cis-trans isomerase C